MYPIASIKYDLVNQSSYLFPSIFAHLTESFFSYLRLCGWSIALDCLVFTYIPGFTVLIPRLYQVSIISIIYSQACILGKLQTRHVSANWMSCILQRKRDVSI